MSGLDLAGASRYARGIVDLPFPFADVSSVKVQLWRDSVGSSACWQTALPSPAKTNDSVKLKFSDKIP